MKPEEVEKVLNIVKEFTEIANRIMGENYSAYHIISKEELYRFISNPPSFFGLDAFEGFTKIANKYYNRPPFPHGEYATIEEEIKALNTYDIGPLNRLIWLELEREEWMGEWIPAANIIFAFYDDNLYAVITADREIGLYLEYVGYNFDEAFRQLKRIIDDIIESLQRLEKRK